MERMILKPNRSQRTVLAPVGACGVQTQEGGALACFLDIDAMFAPKRIEMHVAADDRLELHGHASLGERLLELAKIGREDLEVAFGSDNFAFPIYRSLLIWRNANFGRGAKILKSWVSSGKG